MNSIQLQAGFIFDYVKESLLKESDSDEAGKQALTQIKALLNHLCYFEVISSLKQESPNDKPELAVLNNLISRGLPTRTSLFVENIFNETLNVSKERDVSSESLTTKTNDNFDALKGYFFRALHIIDPRITTDNSVFTPFPSFEANDIGSRYEEAFLFKHAIKRLGGEWLQLLESQRDFKTIVNQDHNFVEQKTDFSVEPPYLVDGKKGIIIEIDGPLHWENEPQKYLDGMRDRAVRKQNWFDTLRIQTRHFDNIHNNMGRLQRLLDLPFFKIVKENYNNPIYSTIEGLHAMQLLLSPFAIARLQKVIVNCLLRDKLSLNSDKWKIAVYERDVPCAAIALADLKQQLDYLLQLQVQDNSFKPDIELTVFNTPEFQSAAFRNVDLSKWLTVNYQDNNPVEEQDEYDLYIDLSILQRPNHTGNDFIVPAKESIIIRSSHHIHSSRKFITSKNIKYKNFVKPNPDNPEKPEYDDAKVELLKPFLKQFFRKQSFREGQLQILNKALQSESVIGLLPTGHGKSLIYQMAALLQPGICIVVDPLKSLMVDQARSLNRYGIDCCHFINSTLNAQEKKEAMNDLESGKVLISFISPERFQIKVFRETLEEMRRNKLSFSYCVIDEVHCVSEWGHDFRLSYLSLGKSADRYCSNPLIGLTATASYDVLTDVERELSYKEGKKLQKLHEDSTVRYEEVNRPELNFQIIEIKADLEGVTDHWGIKERVGNKKKSYIVDFIKKHNDKFDENNQYSGIIFCPHKSSHYGVTGVSSKIAGQNLPFLKLGTFMGSSSDNAADAALTAHDSLVAQEKFINNKLNLLVSTKAFGMGIDKPNIRFTMHFNYPQSIEGFIQEAGRAGRDREEANCYILFNNQVVNLDGKEYDVDNEINMFFHNQSFKGFEKEKQILEELLSGIIYPRRIDLIEELISRNFDIEVRLNLSQATRLWVNNKANNNALGYIDLPQLTFHSTNNREGGVLKTVAEYIRNNIPLANGQQLTPELIIEWFNNVGTKPGLEPLLAENEKVALVIPFENNIEYRVRKLARDLNTLFNTNYFQERIIKKKIGYASSFKDLYEQVSPQRMRSYDVFKARAKERDIIQNADKGYVEGIFKRTFNGYREQLDTEKALYRFSILGFIDDYEVDFNAKCFTVRATRKSDDAVYFRNLESYIRKYYSENRTRQEIENARNYKEENPIRKCLFFLTEFIYREVATKRRQGIGSMREACLVGLDKGNEEFKEFVLLYFNSKYARREYLVGDMDKSLLKRTDSGKKQNIAWVWEFMEVIREDLSAGHVANLKHLRGACIKIMQEHPENATLNLLKAFTLFLLAPDNVRLMKEASESYLRGFMAFMEEYKWSNEEVLEQAAEYKKLTESYQLHPRVQEIMESMIATLTLELHLNWLKDFNERFLEGYKGMTTKPPEYPDGSEVLVETLAAEEVAELKKIE